MMMYHLIMEGLWAMMSLGLGASMLWTGWSNASLAVALAALGLSHIHGILAQLNGARHHFGEDM